MLLPRSLRISPQLKTPERTLCVSLSSPGLCSGNSSLPIYILSSASAIHGDCWAPPSSATSWKCSPGTMLRPSFGLSHLSLFSQGYLCFSPWCLMPETFIYFSLFFLSRRISLVHVTPELLWFVFWSLIRFLPIIDLFLVHWADFLIQVPWGVNFWDSVITYYIIL